MCRVGKCRLFVFMVGKCGLFVFRVGKSGLLVFRVRKCRLLVFKLKRNILPMPSLNGIFCLTNVCPFLVNKSDTSWYFNVTV